MHMHFLEALAPMWRAAIALGGAILASLAIRLVAWRVAAALYRAAGVEAWDRRVASAVSLLASVTVLVAGGYLAVDQLQLTPEQQQAVGRAGVVVVISLATLVAMRLAGIGVEIYVTRAGLRGSAAANINLSRKILQIALLVIGILLVMEQLHYRAGALIAALGLASLGVALALQDTLSNFFAGIWLAVDRPMSRGDFVELESGQAGFVVEVGWRHSKLRTWDDNIVVVPNSRIASAVLVNNSLPSPHTSVYVQCGVAYESNLDQVERVCVEVATQVQKAVEGAVADWKPFVLFREFAGSNINFVVALRIADPKSLRIVRHEFIRAVKARFDQEGIEINYPVSTVYLRGERLGQAPELTIRNRASAPGDPSPSGRET